MYVNQNSPPCYHLFANFLKIVFNLVQEVKYKIDNS